MKGKRDGKAKTVGKNHVFIDLFSEIDSKEEMERVLRRRTRELMALMKISAEMLRTTNLHERLKVIAEAIRSLGWRRVVISLRDENLEMTELVTAGLTPEEIKMLLERKAPGHVWRERLGPKFERYKIGEFYYLPWNDPWVRKNVFKIPDNVPQEKLLEYFPGVPSRLSPEEMVDWHPQDMLYAPLRLPDGRIVGIVSIDDPLDGRRPTRASLAPLELFLHQAAVAIENAELIRSLEEARREIKEYAEKLESMVEERTKALRESEEKRIRAERLAAIGTLAASVGHDLRNPLTGITGAVYYLKMKLGDKIDRKSKEMFKIIEKNIEYANKIINDLLDFSREIHLSLKKVRVKSVLNDVLNQLKIPRKIKIVDLTKPSHVFEVDVHSMKRVFKNIIENAIEAMPKGGKLEIKSFKSKNYMVVSFCDTGVGISKENLKKIFCPLFTTKARGMGLGLAICKRIVEAHNGLIEVESREGKGTCFKVKIPIRRDENGKKKKK